jgi:hypothetical protein
MENALDHHCMLVGHIENQVTTMHRDPHARAVLFS